MDNHDLNVLDHAYHWRKAGYAVWLVTVVETWGSAPRPPGSLLALRDDGHVVGSVSGGCVEDDLIHRLHQGECVRQPSLVTYGVTKNEAARFGLPCGGTLRLVVEPLHEVAWIDTVLQRAREHQLVARILDLQEGTLHLEAAHRDEVFTFEHGVLRSVFGPRWRLLLVGAGQLSQALARMTQMLDFDVTCCDPREEFNGDWQVPGTFFLREMPDDVATAMAIDAHTAVVALSHDPKLDDLVLLEALKSPAFYVGALGSRLNTARRKERLALFDLTPLQIDRLHGPTGLHLGALTPAEIALSIAAELLAVRNHVPVLQKKTGSFPAPRH